MNLNKQSEKEKKSEEMKNEVESNSKARKVGRRIDACGRYYQGE